MKDIREYFTFYPNLKSLTDEEIELLGYSVVDINWVYGIDKKVFNEYKDKYNFKPIAPENGTRNTLEHKIFQFLWAFNGQEKELGYPKGHFPIEEALETVGKLRSGEIDYRTFCANDGFSRPYKEGMR